MSQPPLWNHQQVGIERAINSANFAFFFEMGTGKSRTLIEVLRHHYNTHRRICRTLILCPKIVIDNWPEEFQKYSKIPLDRLVLIRGTAAQRERAWARGMEKHRGNFIAITNYDKLVDNRMENGKKVNRSDVFRKLMLWEPEILVLDESHKAKDLKAERTKAVLRLALPATNPSIKHKYILSGTPVLRDPTDLFSQFLILDGGATFGKEFWPFKLNVMVDKNAAFKGKPNYFPKWEMRPGALNDVHTKMQVRSMSVKKEECLDLPPLVRERRYVEMTAPQKKAYEEMRKHLITFIENKAVSADLALTKALRLLQIASGFAQTEEKVRISFKDTPKMEALRESLEDLTPNHKVIVWAVFHENYAQIRKVCDDLGLKYLEIHGQASDHEKQTAAKRFREESDIRVVIGHPGSGGIGISLVSASYSIFYSRGFSFGDDAQAEARNHRGGSEIHERVTRIDLVTKGTIEEAVLKRLELKQAISDSLLRDILFEE